MEGALQYFSLSDYFQSFAISNNVCYKIYFTSETVFLKEIPRDKISGLKIMYTENFDMAGLSFTEAVPTYPPSAINSYLIASSPIWHLPNFLVPANNIREKQF